MSDDKPPWQVAGVKGVTPPGRRLQKDDKRAVRWSASGVKGVTPPGKQAPGTGPAAEWLAKKEKKRPARAKAGGERPTAGFVPDPGADQNDPRNIKAFLDEVAAFFRTARPDESATIHLAELIGQSHAPYEIITAFTVLSALVGTNTEMRNRFAWALERGAKAFYNLAMRLDKTVKPPRGLAPQRLDPIFYDLPSTAYQIPFAFATEALLRILDLVRGDIGHDRQLMRFARDLYAKYIESRSYGDKPLADMFPWSEPPWAPEDP